ncbi:MAG: TonB-dependent receptor plug domain-containing protein [Oceanicoccus sp.]|uniref:TonB-dependent receptor plug domain-containing protein n=1 Tax=Oceanicoccus sp. TaxID=2691044 RepID=UPI0026292E2A|nr:TonB-dependent receptor [Oceanicoccus sp.]MDG1773120.1 TonB-dependent receptor plug domain-containing protein [Oceanicoccus sp.]
MAQHRINGKAAATTNSLLPVIVLTLSLPLSTLADNNLVTEEDMFGDIPMITGASHFPQTIAEAPTSVTIIDRQMIDASAAVEIVDLFRLIPGFQVYMPHYGRPAINYHGFPQEYSYRMEVKIDGRSVYEPSENAVLWSTLGIELDDIDYIEVIRGANAPADGANATTASVNIITKAPIAVKGWRVRAVAGDWNTQNISAAYSGIEDGFSYKINGGYDYNSGFPTIDGNEFDDNTETSYINLRSIITPTLYDSIDAQAGYSDSNIDMADSGRSISVQDIIKWDYESFYLFTGWERRLANQDSFELLFYYNRANIDAPENLGLFSDLLGVRPSDVPDQFPGLDDFEVLYGLYDSYAERSDLEFRYKGDIGGSTRYMLGLASRYDRMKSERQFIDAVDVEESSQRLFTNIETKATDHWTFNAGVIIEYNKIVDDYASYRLSANYKINPNHSLRFAYNDGERSPGLYEANQQSGVTEAGYPLDVDTVAPDDLDTEKFESQEISYYGNLLDQALTLEIKLFKEKSRDLVKYTNMDTDSYFDFTDLNGDFTLRTNSAWVNAEGIETQIKYQPDQHWLVNFQYSYTDHEGLWLRQIYDTGRLRINSWDDIAPAEMTSLTTAYFFASGLEASVMIYYQDETEWEQGDPSDDYVRVDARLAKRLRAGGNEVLIELIGQNVFDQDYSEFHRINDYESRYLLRLTVGL